MMNADNLTRPARRMDLQLFAEGDVTPAPDPMPTADPEPAQPTGAQETARPATFNEWLDDYEAKQATEPQQDMQWQDTQQQEPQAEPQAEPIPAAEPLIMGKFKTQADLEKAYQEAQRKISELGQTNSLTAREMQIMRDELAQVRQFISQQQQQPPKPEEQRLSPEQEQELFNKLYDSENPITDLFGYLQPVIEGQVKPLQEKIQAYEQERYWNNQVMTAQQKFPDFQQMVPEVSKIIQENPALVQLPNAIEQAYNLAKARQVLTQPPQPSIDEMLNNPDFLKTLAQNENVRKEILKSHAQQVQGNQPPPVIGKQPGGHAPATPREPIKSVGDATKMFRAHLDRVFGGGS